MNLNLKELLDLGTDALDKFKDHPLILAAVIAVALIVGALLQRWRDGGVISALRERLTFAHEKADALNEQIGRLEKKVTQLEGEAAKLQATMTSPQVQIFVEATSTVAKTMNEVRVANAELQQTFTTITPRVSRDVPGKWRSFDDADKDYPPGSDAQASPPKHKPHGT